MTKDNEMTKEKKEEVRKSGEYHGKAFVKEPTGSATQINLDGQWEHDFYDHKED